MTDAPLIPGIGRRVAGYRKLMGFATAKELAEAIPNEKVTASVLQNIESGRKSDLAVSQLLDIAMGLGISPLFLLVPVGRPFEKLDLPGVGDNIRNMTVHEFDEWFAVSARSNQTESREAAVLRRILQWMRSLIEAVDQEKAAAVDPDLDAEDEVWEDENGVEQIHRLNEGAIFALERSRQRVDTLYRSLERYKVDLSWVQRPWHDNV